MSQPNIAILLLAAGASFRMGQPKQLLKINPTQNFLQYTITEAQKVSCQQLVVVIGANAAAISKSIAPLTSSIVKNEDWKKGMGTSLQAGLRSLLKENASLEAVIISVCDQPYLTSDIFQQLIHVYQTTKAPIVTSDYGNKLGVPALLDRQFFSQLLTLQADEGARKIIRGHFDVVQSVPFPEGAFDLDTPEAYEVYLNRQNGNF